MEQINEKPELPKIQRVQSRSNQNNIVRMPALPIRISNNLTKQLQRLQIVLDQVGNKEIKLDLDNHHFTNRGGIQKLSQSADEKLKSPALGLDKTQTANSFYRQKWAGVSFNKNMNSHQNSPKLKLSYESSKPIASLLKKSQYTKQELDRRIIKLQTNGYIYDFNNIQKKKYAIVGYEFNQTVAPNSEIKYPDFHSIQIPDRYKPNEILSHFVTPHIFLKYPKLILRESQSPRQKQSIKDHYFLQMTQKSICLQSKKFGLKERIIHAKDYVPSLDSYKIVKTYVNKTNNKIRNLSQDELLNVEKLKLPEKEIFKRVTHQYEQVLTDMDTDYDQVKVKNWKKQLKILQARNQHVQGTIVKWQKQFLK